MASEESGRLEVANKLVQTSLVKKKQHIATLHSVEGGGRSEVLPQQNSVLYIQLIAISHFSEFSLITVTRIKT